MTQKEVGAECGMADSNIRAYELEKVTPKFDTLQRIAKALGVSVGYLLGTESVKEVIPGRLRIIETNAPDAKDIQYSIEATDPEAYAIGLQIFESAGAPLSTHSPYARIASALSKLNPAGQQKATERVEALLEVPKYLIAPPENMEEK